MDPSDLRGIVARYAEPPRDRSEPDGLEGLEGLEGLDESTAPAFDREGFQAEMEALLTGLRQRLFYRRVALIALGIAAVLIAVAVYQSESLWQTITETRGVLVAIIGITSGLVGWLVMQMLALSKRAAQADMIRGMAKFASDDTLKETLKVIMSKLPDVV